MENNFIDMNEKDEYIEHANFASAYTTPGPEERNLSEMKKVYTFSFFFSIQNIQNDSILFLQQLYFTSLNVLFIIQKKESIKEFEHISRRKLPQYDFNIEIFPR